MANNCFYQMRIAGKKESVEQLIAMLSGEAPASLGRVFSADMEEPFTPYPSNRSIGYADISGDCAWSIKEAMLSPKNPSVTLATEAKRLGLAVEAYSSEPANCFQEHVLIDKGDILTFDRVDYHEYYLEDMSKRHLAELCQEQGLTREELFSEAAVDGMFVVGGFGDDFANFSDLSAYLSPQPKVSDLLQTRAEAYAKSAPALSADLQQQKDGTVRLWARVGMSLDVSPETYTRLKDGDKKALTAVLQGKEGRAFLDGETYFPDTEVNVGLEDMEFDLYADIHPLPAPDKQPSKSPLDAQIQGAQSRTTQDKPNNEKEAER